MFQRNAKISNFKANPEDQKLTQYKKKKQTDLYELLIQVLTRSYLLVITIS